MSVTDQAFLSEIQAAMLEPTVDGGVTWTSSMWTAAEVLQYVNQRQDRFLKESGLLTAWTTFAVSAGQLHPSFAAAAPDWVATVRLSWKGTGDLTFVVLPRGDSWSADNGVPTWPTTTATRPQIYMDGETNTLQMQLAPAPTGAGTLSMYYVSVGNTLDGTGEIFNTPDEFIPALKYGVMADMLTKLGRTQDGVRAGYCETRFEEGVVLAKGWISGNW